MNRSSFNRYARAMPKWCAFSLAFVALAVVFAVTTQALGGKVQIAGAVVYACLFLTAVGLLARRRSRQFTTEQRLAIGQVCNTGTPSGDVAVDYEALRRLRQLANNGRLNRGAGVAITLALVAITIFDGVHYDLRWLLALIVTAPLPLLSLLNDPDTASRRNQLELVLNNISPHG